LSLLLFQLIVILLLGVFLYLTPIGSSIFQRQDPQVMAAINDLSTRIRTLKDSLQITAYQIDKLKTIMSENSDTVFQISPDIQMFAADDSSLISEIQTENPLFAVYDAWEMDGLPSLITDKNLIAIDELSAASTVVEFSRPTNGRISRAYDESIKHYGIDFATTTGEFARSVENGIVVQSDWTWNFGYVVVIQHQEGYISVYKHLTNSKKKQGDYISRGDVIGTTGDAGLISTGPHLHFELWKDGLPLNPQTIIR
jgi:murein DD-endopeptidase MepM/ murein hydrolase activator NlpD